MRGWAPRTLEKAMAVRKAVAGVKAAWELLHAPWQALAED